MGEEDASMGEPSSGCEPCGLLKLGELLIARGVMTPQQVAHVLDVQAVTTRPFGDLAERLFGVNPKLVAGAWVKQFVGRNPPRDVTRESVDLRWLRMLERRQAWQFRMMPMRREEGFLLVAVCARGLLKAVNFASRAFPLTPCFVVAQEGSLRDLLMRHYPVPQELADFAFKR
jgi:hypothetical protein